MPAAAIHKVQVIEDCGASLMARVKGNDAANITQSVISSIAYTVIDKTSGSTVASGSLTVATVVFNSLQTDARWTLDSTGYNFRWDAPASTFPTGNRTYRIEIIFTPTSGAVFALLYEASTIPLLAS